MTHDEINARLEAYAKLPRNWDSYDADPVTPTAIETMRQILLDSRTTAPTHLVACSDGGLQAEWNYASFAVELSVSAQGKVESFVCDYPVVEDTVHIQF